MSETSKQTLQRQGKDRKCKASTRASETSEQTLQRYHIFTPRVLHFSAFVHLGLVKGSGESEWELNSVQKYGSKQITYTAERAGIGKNQVEQNTDPKSREALEKDRAEQKIEELQIQRDLLLVENKESKIRARTLEGDRDTAISKAEAAEKKLAILRQTALEKESKLVKENDSLLVEIQRLQDKVRVLEEEKQSLRTKLRETEREKKLFRQRKLEAESQVRAFRFEKEKAEETAKFFEDKRHRLKVETEKEKRKWEHERLKIEERVKELKNERDEAAEKKKKVEVEREKEKERQQELKDIQVKSAQNIDLESFVKRETKIERKASSVEVEVQGSEQQMVEETMGSDVKTENLERMSGGNSEMEKREVEREILEKRVSDVTKGEEDKVVALAKEGEREAVLGEEGERETVLEEEGERETVSKEEGRGRQCRRKRGRGGQCRRKRGRGRKC